MSRWWLAPLVPGFVVFAVLLALAVRHLVALYRAPPLAAVPLVAEHDVALDTRGNVLLQGEGPRFTSAFRHLRYALVRRDTGQPIRLEPIVFRMQQSGMSTVRLSLVSFALDAPGTYVLRIDGLDAGVDYSRCRIVFTRDTRAQLIGTILATVLCAMGTIGTLAIP